MGGAGASGGECGGSNVMPRFFTARQVESRTMRIGPILIVPSLVGSLGELPIHAAAKHSRAAEKITSQRPGCQPVNPPFQCYSPYAR